ncbi:short chain dehydrogenase/oxidoreductase [Microthyrium microscopicum]|uniref:Short chain dehydrogenase/oxidoreductase n=1 Tax=Microthyrium microscopicum TaxID=703497 RepID=A0A6A6UJZ4_9PEZI|nr:short chain dehydrogenase/oxidoreductase [Microthyrium microscopicum]
MTGSLYKDKTVIITGSAGGLGLSIAQAFYEEGANVVVTDINEKLLADCPSHFPEADRDTRLHPVKCDGTDGDAVEKMVQEVVAKYGRLDVLVNNAAVNDSMQPVHDCPRAVWDMNIAVNLTAPFLSSQVAIKQFLAQEPKGGVILNVASAAGQNGYRAGAAYTASKHGLIGLTKNTAAFYSQQGIRCVAICPGPMQTPLASKDASKYHPEGVKLAGSSMASGLWWNPLNEVAKTVTWMCSSGVGTINGAIVTTDYGWTAI